MCIRHPAEFLHVFCFHAFTKLTIATCSVDVATEALLQDLILREFQGCTIIAIAHRLDTILDYDRVIVMDKGRVCESGRPRELLALSGSRFRRLYESLD